MSDEIQRNIGSIRLPQWGRVEQGSGIVPWLVYDDADEVVDPIRRYLADCVARDHSPASVRSYAYGLLRWWRWLRVLEVDWDKATPPAEGRDLVLWLTQAPKPRRAPRTKSKKTAGTVNTRTRKRYLDDRYATRTIRHSNAVVRAFYESGTKQGKARYSTRFRWIGAARGRRYTLRTVAHHTRPGASGTTRSCPSSNLVPSRMNSGRSCSMCCARIVIGHCCPWSSAMEPEPRKSCGFGQSTSTGG